MRIEKQSVFNFLTGSLMIGCALFSGCSESGGGSSKDDFSVSTNAAPFAVLSLGASSLNDSDQVQVVFSNESGYSATVPATSANPLEVAVPLYLNPITGALDSGTVTLTALYPDGSTKTVAGSLFIAAPPTLDGLAPGVLTQAFIQGTLDYTSETQTLVTDLKTVDSAKSVLVTAEVEADLAEFISRLTTMNNAVSEFMLSGTKRELATFSTAEGSATISLDSNMLVASDRIIAAYMDQILALQNGTLQKTMATSAGEEATDYYPTKVKDCFLDLTKNISSNMVAWGKTSGSAIGGVSAGVALAAVIVGAAPAVAITAGVIGAMGFLSTTFVPSVCAMYLNAGVAVALNGSANYEDIREPLYFMVQNTIAQGASTVVGSSLDLVSGGDLASAMFGTADYVTSTTARAGAFLTESFIMVSPNPCSCSFSSEGKTFISIGGNGSFAVTATDGCSWTAESSVSWITITSENPMSGTGLLQYSVDANTSSVERKGKITVGEETFTITQPSSSSESLSDNFDGVWKGTVNATWSKTYTPSTYSSYDTTYDAGNTSIYITIENGVISEFWWEGGTRENIGTVDESGNLTADISDSSTVFSLSGTLMTDGNGEGTFLHTDKTCSTAYCEYLTFKGNWTATRE